MATDVRTITDWTVEKLIALTGKEAVELFKTLPTAEFEEMDGEYRGYLPNGGDEEVKKRQAQGIFNEETSFGCWLGKAFTRLNESEGEGYNYCRKPGARIVRHLRYATYMGTSHVDGQRVFIVRYAAFKNGSGDRDLTDEVRRVADGLYLCVSTNAASEGGRTAPGAFVLAGPERAWVGVDDPNAEDRR
jgi:hypothetical protein